MYLRKNPWAICTDKIKMIVQSAQGFCDLKVLGAIFTRISKKIV